MQKLDQDEAQRLAAWHLLGISEGGSYNTYKEVTAELESDLEALSLEQLRNDLNFKVTIEWDEETRTTEHFTYKL